MTKTIDTLRVAMPGLLLSATIALAVRFISDRLGGPAMLYALLFGMAFNFLTEASSSMATTSKSPNRFEAEKS